MSRNDALCRGQCEVSINEVTLWQISNLDGSVVHATCTALFYRVQEHVTTYEDAMSGPAGKNGLPKVGFRVIPKTDGSELTAQHTADAGHRYSPGPVSGPHSEAEALGPQHDASAEEQSLIGIHIQRDGWPFRTTAFKTSHRPHCNVSAHTQRAKSFCTANMNACSIRDATPPCVQLVWLHPFCSATICIRPK